MTQMYEVMDYKDKNIYSLDEMIDMYDNDKLNYSFVSKRICCPCCELKITDIKIDDESASIRSKRSEHKPDCDYYGLKISQNDIKKMIKNKEKFDFENKYPKKRLPQKSIERKLTEDDFDVYKLFYGRVMLKSAHSKDETRYKNYSIKALKGDVIGISITSGLFISGKEIIKKLDNNFEKEVDVKFLGIITKNDKYNNMVLKHFELIEIK